MRRVSINNAAGNDNDDDDDDDNDNDNDDICLFVCTIDLHDDRVKP